MLIILIAIIYVTASIAATYIYHVCKRQLLANIAEQKPENNAEQKIENNAVIFDAFYIIINGDNNLHQKLIFIGKKLCIDSTYRNDKYSITEAAIKMLISKYAVQNLDQLKHAVEKELIAINLYEFEEKTHAY